VEPAIGVERQHPRPVRGGPADPLQVVEIVERKRRVRAEEARQEGNK
jgi:hypothetical protein